MKPSNLPIMLLDQFFDLFFGKGAKPAQGIDLER
jgi:hypothetical protein